MIYLKSILTQIWDFEMFPWQERNLRFKNVNVDRNPTCALPNVSLWRFSQTHKIGNIATIANFVFPYICSFLLYLH